MEVKLNIGMQSPAFKAALTKKEEKGFKKTQEQAQKALGVDDGIRMFKVFAQSLPQDADKNTGIGKLNSGAALEYLKFMALYTGANTIKEFPIGQMSIHHKNSYYGPYGRSTSMIGEDGINLFNLTTEKYDKLLTPKDIKNLVVPSKEGHGYKEAINFENELGKDHNFPILKPLRKAYDNMLQGNGRIKKEFEQYKKELKNDSIERYALYPIIAEKEPDLFKDFDNSPKKQARFEKYKEQHKDEVDFFKFRKFIATKEHQEAKKAINKEGLELFGDCPIGFSPQEVWAHPDAFYPEHITPGWGFRTINYEEISKEGTGANRLFREKLAMHLENYDGIRFDVGWQYFNPNVKNKLTEERHPISVGEDVINFIEKTAREIKGKDYDTKKLMYESDAGPDDYKLFDWTKNGPVPNPALIGRTSILTTQYESGNGWGWGNPQFLDKAGLKGSYMIGTNNHDGAPLRALAEDKEDINGHRITSLGEVREGNVSALKKSLNLSNKETKALKNPKNFVKAKFAEISIAKNNFVFFNDVMGNKKRTDEESNKTHNYRIRVGKEYEKEYHTALQNNDGYNLMESYKIGLEAKGLDKTNKKLYNKVSKYAKYLRLEGPKTREEAQIEQMEGKGGFKTFGR